VRNNPANTNVREGEGGEGEGAPSARAGIFLQPMGRTTMEQMSTLQAVEELCSLWRSPHQRRGIFCQGNGSVWRGIHAGTGSSGRKCHPRRTHSRVDLF